MLFLIIIIIVIILAIITIVINNSTIENFQDITTVAVNPIVELAKETTKLEAVKVENKEITTLTEKLKLVRNELERRIDELNRTIEEKNQNKLKVENEIDEINKQKTNALAVFQVLKNKIDDADVKQLELAKKEKDLENKEEEIKKIGEIKENQLTLTIFKKLEEISNKLNKNNKEFCNNTKEIPKIDFKTYDNIDDDLANNWCLCNDTNKKTEACVNYMTCKKNYDDNKDKSKLSGNELDVYFKCIDLYPNFPKYIIKK